jgi:hypothetical protein
MAKTRRKTKGSARPKARAKPSSRRRFTAARARKSPARKKRQRFVVSHAHEAKFDEGLRAYAKYRDLGIKDATGGLVQAHVIRFIPPFRAEDVSQPHYHDVDFQMVYVLKGWFTSEFEGQGVHTFREGSAWIQPPGIKHTVLGYSDDCELLEIIMPADFETVMLA